MNDQSACEAGGTAHPDSKGSDQPVAQDQVNETREAEAAGPSLGLEAPPVTAGGRVGGALAEPVPASQEETTLEVSFTDLSGAALAVIEPGPGSAVEPVTEPGTAPGAAQEELFIQPAAAETLVTGVGALTIEAPIDPVVVHDGIVVPEDAEIVVEPEAEPEILFSDLGLSEPILRAIEEKGYRHPTPIQAQAIPAVLSGRDVMGVAQTGTGKTASFTLPMLDILSGSRARARMPRSLILEPTRELALQVAENFVEYGKHLKLNHALLIGGESLNDQKEALMKGVDVLIATPGRLIDLFERGGMMLTDAKLLVIDEADRMLDMGFIPDVEKHRRHAAEDTADAVLLGHHGAGDPPPVGCLPIRIRV